MAYPFRVVGEMIGYNYGTVMPSENEAFILETMCITILIPMGTCLYVDREYHFRFVRWTA